MKKTFAVLILALLSTWAFATVYIGSGVIMHATDVGTGKVTLPGIMLRVEMPLNDNVGFSLNAEFAMLSVDNKAGALTFDFYFNLLSDPDLVSVRLLLPLGLIFDTVDGNPDTAFGDPHIAAGLGLELTAPIGKNIALLGTIKGLRVKDYPANLYSPVFFEYFTGGLGLVWSF
ncbi:hypothetical protein [Kosmotoga pacifica]|uniref:Outer membrane protein beta-barrel domain-containing protein n=1 Tax=Kosmotoga pacifica TaxID=1330330 RepID=A0A0G2Z9X2_9BACT|nr:hypothetical protein [Kosmotoga pacifica]AKI96891.1 hypothetical protein IX53_02575 [Kosmotoga pacifica]